MLSNHLILCAPFSFLIIITTTIIINPGAEIDPLAPRNLLYPSQRSPLVTQIVKTLLAVEDTRVQSLGWEDPLENGMAPYSSILAWKIPWVEEPGRLQSRGRKELDTTEYMSNTSSKNWSHEGDGCLCYCCSVVQSSQTVTPWTTAHQAFLCFTISQRLLKLMSIEWVMPSNHLILCHSLLLLPSIFPSIRVFSGESSLQVAKVLELQLQHQIFQ